MRFPPLAIAMLLALADIASAQFPPQPIPAPGPLMYVRFTGEKGMKVTVYRGVDPGKTFDLPVTLGFRPGYAYRLAVSDVPGLPRQVFSPSLEVRGTLALSPKARNADFPAYIHLSADDFGQASLGAYIKKVIALERPDKAVPAASKASEPIEIVLPATSDPVVEAADRGQPLIVYQLGQRVLTPQELSTLGVPGTVLLPGERVLGVPRVPPYLLWNGCPVHDPVLGPRPPSEFTTLCDGGDSFNPAGFDRFGKLKGLDPSDTIAAYQDSKGNQRLAASNRVGLAVPRFIVFKTERTLASQQTRSNLGSTVAAATPASSVGQVALKEQAHLQNTESVKSRLRLSGAFQSLATSVVGRMQGLEIRASLKNTKAVSGAMAPRLNAEPEDGPLLIIKWPDKTLVNVGDVVTFYLKYSNTGGQPITNVVVSDSLAARFEYVPGSTKTDRDATFTTQPNEAGSTLLRWEFTGALPPREHGLITFQVRVR